MGLDISKTCTGIAIMDKQKKLVFFDHYKPTSSDIKEVALEYAFLIDLLISNYPIEQVIIEDTFVQKGSSVKDLSLVHGSILMNLLMKNITIKKIVNTSCKSYHGAKADKENELDAKEVLFNIIKKRYNLTHFEFQKHNDITDAIALAACFDNTKIVPKKRTRNGIKETYYVPVLKSY